MAGENVGVYGINQGGLGLVSANYDLSYQGNNLTITSLGDGQVIALVAQVVVTAVQCQVALVDAVHADILASHAAQAPSRCCLPRRRG